MKQIVKIGFWKDTENFHLFTECHYVVSSA